MNTATYLETLVVLHLSGLIIMAGTTLVDYILFKTFWKQFSIDPQNSLSILKSGANFSRIIGIGAALLIFTGIGMMALTHGVFGEQLWFRIKFGLVIILILNGILVGRRQALKFRKVAANGVEAVSAQTKSLKGSLNIFYLSQLLIFLCIIFLSVFKFS